MAANTFKEQGYATTTSVFTRVRSVVFILNLNKLKNRASTYTDATLSINTTSWGYTPATLSYTPDVAGSAVFGVYWGFVPVNGARNARSRAQVDGTDDPDTQTSDAYLIKGKDASDVRPIPHSTITDSLSTSAHTLACDCYATGSSTAQERGAWAFSLELAVSGTTVAIPAGSVSLAGAAAFLALSLALPVGNVAVTGELPVSRIGQTIQVPAGSVDLIGSTLANLGLTLAPDVGALSATGAVHVLDRGIAVGQGTLDLTGYEPLCCLFCLMSTSLQPRPC